MSTIKVDNIEPFSGGQVNIQGLNVTGYASTGSNEFIGDQIITGSLTVSGSTEFDLNVNGRTRIFNTTGGPTAALVISGSDYNTFHGRFSTTYNNTGTDRLSVAALAANGGNINFFSSSFEYDWLLAARINGAIGQGYDGPGITMWNNSINDYVDVMTLPKGQDWGNGTVTFNAPLDINGNTNVNGTLFIQDGSFPLSMSSGSQGIQVFFNDFGATQPTLFFNGVNSYFQANGNFFIENRPGGVGSGSIAIQTNGNINMDYRGDIIAKNDAPTGNTEFFLRKDNDKTGSVRFGAENSSTGGNTTNTEVYGTSAAGRAYMWVRGTSGLIEAYDNTADSAIALLANLTGGYIADYSPITNDYEPAIKFQLYSNYNNGLIEILRNTDITGSLTVSSSVSIGQALTLAPQDPLPNADTGSLAVSGSDLYYYNGTTWSQIN
jgi:hypothetical protein